jgi:hypothetical protein
MGRCFKIPSFTTDSSFSQHVAASIDSHYSVHTIHTPNVRWQDMALAAEFDSSYISCLASFSTS